MNKKVIITPEKVVYDRYCIDNDLDSRKQIWIHDERSMRMRILGSDIKEEDVVYEKWAYEIPHVREWITTYIRSKNGSPRSSK